MSCIYGPHQFGTEDQGWVAHFLIKALEKSPITIYGDGRQVRDILFVEDLIDALSVAQERIDDLSGEAFNIGGGPSNTISLLELMDLIEETNGTPAEVHFSDWRPADQRYYVSDTRAFSTATGWEPKVDVRTGIAKLYHWLAEFRQKPISPVNVRVLAGRTRRTPRFHLTTLRTKARSGKGRFSAGAFGMPGARKRADRQVIKVG